MDFFGFILCLAYGVDSFEGMDFLVCGLVLVVVAWVVVGLLRLRRRALDSEGECKVLAGKVAEGAVEVAVLRGFLEAVVGELSGLREEFEKELGEVRGKAEVAEGQFCELCGKVEEVERECDELLGKVEEVEGMCRNYVERVDALGQVEGEKLLYGESGGESVGLDALRAKLAAVKAGGGSSGSDESFDYEDEDVSGSGESESSFDAEKNFAAALASLASAEEGCVVGGGDAEQRVVGGGDAEQHVVGWGDAEQRVAEFEALALLASAEEGLVVGGGDEREMPGSARGQTDPSQGAAGFGVVSCVVSETSFDPDTVSVRGLIEELKADKRRLEEDKRRLLVDRDSEREYCDKVWYDVNGILAAQREAEEARREAVEARRDAANVRKQLEELKEQVTKMVKEEAQKRE
eukprot:1449820-Rhodomonas_salina.1